MRASFSLGIALALRTTLSAADPPAPSVEDGVAASLVRLVDARAHGDAAAVRALMKLPLRITWNENNGQGDCTVPRKETLSDPLKAAAALTFDPRFLAVMRHDKGHTHQGTGCEEESSNEPFTHGDPAITVRGNTATVNEDVPLCQAGAPIYTLSLTRVGGVWWVVGYDSGCHY